MIARDSFSSNLILLKDQRVGCQGSRSSTFRSQGTRTHFKIRSYRFLNTTDYSHTILLSFRKRFIWVPGSQEPGTRNMVRVPVPENLEPTVSSRFREPETDTPTNEFNLRIDRKFLLTR